jgi:molybdenum cofactor cytidylyltransferase/nicotine blue oxidoreductase
MTRPPLAAETEPEIGGIVLAAGEGKRFGGPKQVAQLDGRPLLEHAVRAMLAVPSISPVVVVLGAHAREVRDAVDLDGADVVVCEDWADGQSASLRAGVAALGEVEAAVITLGDQPFITPQVIAGVLDHRGRHLAVRATYDGKPGHPVLLERRLLDHVTELEGDVGARELLDGDHVLPWEVGRLCDPTDIDTPERLQEVQS